MPSDHKKPRAEPKPFIQYRPDSTFYELAKNFYTTREASWGFPAIIEVQNSGVRVAIGHHANQERRVFFTLIDLVTSYGILGSDLCRLEQIPRESFKGILAYKKPHLEEEEKTQEVTKHAPRKQISLL